MVKVKAELCSLSLPIGEGGVVELWERRTNGGLGFGFRIILGKRIWFEKGEYIYLIKRNKLDLRSIASCLGFRKVLLLLLFFLIVIFADLS